MGSCQIGVKTGSRCRQIIHLEAIVPIKDRHCLVSGNFHNGEMINPCPSHVIYSRMAKIVETKTLNSSPSTCSI